MCQFHQETNTFNPIVMTAALFNNGMDGEDPRVYESAIAVQSAEKGAMDAFTSAGAQMIPSIFYRSSATSGGRVSDSLLSGMMQRMTDYI